MLKYIVLLALIALVAIAFGSDRIEQFQSCVKACRGEKNTFRFCTKFCKPPKSAEVSKPKPAAKADKKKRDPHAERVLKEILGDDYAVESDADPKPSLDTLTPQSKELWRKYKSVLLDFFRQGNPNALPGLQLVPNPFPADWDQDQNVLNFLCDTIPHWAPAYEPSRNLLSTQYGDWLLNLKIPNEKAAKTNFREIDNKLRDAEDRINNAEMQCMDRYDMRYGTRRPGYGEPESFANYTARFCLSLYREQANYDVLLAEYESMQYDTFGEHFALKRAIAKFSTEGRKGPYKFLSLGSMARFVESAKEQRTNSFEIKITSKTKVTTEKTFTTSIGLSYTMQNNPFSSSSTPASTLQDVPPEGETPPPTETPTETPTSAPSTPSTPSTPSEGGVKPFMSIGINYSSTKYEFKTSTEELQLIVGAAGYKVFPVMPDRTWFSPEVFDKYKKNALKRPKNYFGIDGTMPMYPKMLIVVAGPRLTMLVSKEDASKMEKTSELKANIEVAGFKFDFAKNSKMTKTTEANNLFKITIEGNSYEPQVLAVDNEILADVKLPGMTL